MCIRRITNGKCGIHDFQKLWRRYVLPWLTGDANVGQVRTPGQVLASTFSRMADRCGIRFIGAMMQHSGIDHSSFQPVASEIPHLPAESSPAWRATMWEYECMARTKHIAYVPLVA